MTLLGVAWENANGISSQRSPLSLKLVNVISQIKGTSTEEADHVCRRPAIIRWSFLHVKVGCNSKHEGLACRGCLNHHMWKCPKKTSKILHRKPTPFCWTQLRPSLACTFFWMSSSAGTPQRDASQSYTLFPFTETLRNYLVGAPGTGHPVGARWVSVASQNEKAHIKFFHFANENSQLNSSPTL